MADRSKSDDITDNIFNNENDVLRNARKIMQKEGLSSDEVLKEYEFLTEQYSALLNQTKKMVRISDVTQRKLLNTQNELKEKNQKIEQQNEMLSSLNATKDKFFSIISHDLRNPITAVMLLADILKYSADKLSKEELKNKISSILEAVKNLYDLFENLLRWSRSQKRNIDLRREKVYLSELINSIFNLLKINAINKHISLVSEISPSLYIIADKNMIETVIRNLVSNAIKFTNIGGEIHVMADVDGDRVIIKVKDNGVGIPPENLPKLFDIQHNVKTKGTANERGSGLGLILCKEFVERHSGIIKAEINNSEGSTFIISLPVKV